MPTVLTETAVLSVVTDDEPRADGPRPAPALCPNCGEPRAGRFCAECGQREMGSRLTLRALWTEFASRVFNLNRGLLHTVVSLAKSPGAVPRDYVEGRRRTYTNPLSFFLLATAFSLLTMGLYEGEMREQAREMVAVQEAEREAAHAGHDHADEPSAFDESVGSGEEFMMAYMEEMIGTMKRWNTALTLVLCVPLVLLMRVLFGSARNVAELSVFALYTVGFGVLVSALLVPAAVWAGWSTSPALMVAGLVVYAGIVAWGSVRFYDDPPAGVAARGAVAMTVAYGVYFVGVMILGAAIALAQIADKMGITFEEAANRLAS